MMNAGSPRIVPLQIAWPNEVGEDQTVSRRQVFDYLNGIYFVEFGEDRYPSWNAFRHSREYRSRD